MIIGLGSDLCNIERIAAALERHGERFELRCFTEVERAKAARAAVHARRALTPSASPPRKPSPRRSAPGSIAGVYMKDIGVVNAPSGAPTLTLTGGAAKRLAEIGPGRP